MPVEIKTNYQILEENKKAVLDFADNIKTKPILGQNAIKAKQTEAKGLLNAGHFSEAIQKLNEI